MTPDNSAEARAKAYTARALDDGVKAGFAAVVDGPDGWPIGHFMRLDEAEKVATALTFSAEQNTGGMPGRTLEEGVKQFREDSADEDGFWRTCSGCYECEDGYPNGEYQHSDALGCTLGGGCGDCGGIGAIWDTTDYEKMVADMLADDRAESLSLAGTGGTGAEGWRNIASAPKDEQTPILVWFDHDADPYHDPANPTRLTDYAAIAESGDYCAGRGVVVAVWRNGYHDSDGWEVANQYWVPGGWFPFLDGDATEQVCNALFWQPLPTTPGEQS